MIENKNQAIFKSKERKYRCSRGHEWVTNDWTGLINALVLNGQNFCVRCIVDFMKDKIGIVEECDTSK